jgi:hypothetical protein
MKTLCANGATLLVMKAFYRLREVPIEDFREHRKDECRYFHKFERDLFTEARLNKKNVSFGSTITQPCRY